ncbi:MAG: hypothetical protein ACKO5Q_01370, partial [Microcystaceae cyanobacterium]
CAYRVVLLETVIVPLKVHHKSTPSKAIPVQYFTGNKFPCSVTEPAEVSFFLSGLKTLSFQSPILFL